MQAFLATICISGWDSAMSIACASSTPASVSIRKYLFFSLPMFTLSPDVLYLNQLIFPEKYTMLYHPWLLEIPALIGPHEVTSHTHQWQLLIGHTFAAPQ